MKSAWFLVLLLCGPAAGQSVVLRGVVTDESGGVVPGATVAARASSGAVRAVRTNQEGAYAVTGLTPGDFTVTVSAPGLALPEPAAVRLTAGTTTLNLELKIAGRTDEVTVGDAAGQTVSTDSANNAGALVLRGDNLQALGDDPSDLAADLQALAGPSAGPNGGSIFVDGFSGGQLPSKESIREVRVNQNPFSPEYDKLGLGRIEIFTKPGSEKFKASAYYNFADAFWNSRNPYAAEKAPFRLHEYGGSLSGPAGRRGSFFLDLRRDDITNGAIIHGITLDPATLQVVDPYTEVHPVPQRRFSASPRVDYQLGANHTLSARYSFTRADIQDAGVGSFNLVSRGYHSLNDSQTAQITETSLLGKSIVNETRFQYFRFDSSSTANNLTPALQVLGSFNGGGAQVGQSGQISNNYEIQNYTSVLRGAHSWRFGARVRIESVDNVSRQNFGGTYTFGGGTGPILDSQWQPVRDASGQPAVTAIDSIERYRRTLRFLGMGLAPAQIRLLGGGATQFTMSAGTPGLDARQVDLGLFVGDDWRVRPDLTVSAGLRYETQNNLGDWRDFAPRVGLAWAPGAKSSKTRPKSVIRAGFGMFYDRFGLERTIAARRYDGQQQQQYVVTDPDFFPSIPAPGQLAGMKSPQAVQRISSNARAPYLMQSALSYERQLPFGTTVALTYANAHGVHLLRSQDVNAPLAGTYSPATPASGVYPMGTPGAVFLLETAGLYNQNQLITSVNSKVNKNVSLFGSYVLNLARSNTDGSGTFPAVPYSFAGEYGPAAIDVRHRVTLGGTLAARWDVRFNPLLTIESGPPFDITVGKDLYGTTLFNGRPGIGSDPAKPGLIATEYGLLDPNPAAGQPTLGRNAGRGPGAILLNLRAGKTFSFGTGAGHEAPTNIPGGAMQRQDSSGVFVSGAGAGGARTSRRYNLTISMSFRNLLNHTNPGPIVGNITSPLFGRANQPAGSGGGGGFSEAANNRRLELQTRFTF